MKKFIALFICINMLFGCGGMHQLRTSEKNKKGHNEQVKHIVMNKNETDIIIPVQYNEVYEGSLPNELPDELNKTLQQTPLTSTAKCNGNCNLNKDKLTIKLIYVKNSDINENFCTAAWVGFLNPFLLPIALLKTISECTGTNLITDPNIIMLNPFEKLNQQNLGVNVKFDITPKKMSISCDKKSCAIINEKGDPINNIKIEKTISINNKRIKELLIQEKEKEEKELKEYQQKRKQQKKECPGLYSTLYMAQQGYYIDPALGLSVAKKFEELHCGDWLNEQLSGYDY